MKIVLSPSKTKTLHGVAGEGLFHEAMTHRIVEHVKGLSKEELGKALKIKEATLDEVYDFFQHYDRMPEGAAGYSYSGLAFKSLDWAGLDERGKAFGQQHLRILSALYGLVAPHSAIKDYRLDLVDGILKKEKTNLYAWWEEPVNEALAEEDWILNLASKEYSKLIHHPRMVTVEFLEEKQGVWKQLSTSSKQMRGRFAHYVMAHGIESINELPLVVGDFHLEGTLPKKVTECITLEYKKRG